MSKSNGVTSYTLTKDCFVQVHLNFNTTAGVSVLVNDVPVVSQCTDVLMITYPPFICKKEDIISINIWDGTPYDWYIKIFDVK